MMLHHTISLSSPPLPGQFPHQPSHLRRPPVLPLRGPGLQEQPRPPPLGLDHLHKDVRRKKVTDEWKESTHHVKRRSLLGHIHFKKWRKKIKGISWHPSASAKHHTADRSRCNHCFLFEKKKRGNMATQNPSQCLKGISFCVWSHVTWQHQSNPLCCPVFSVSGCLWDNSTNIIKSYLE